MTQAGKVAEIFTVAGEAFSKLGTLAMSLQPASERPQEASKWGDEEIDMLRKAVKQFGADVEKISNKIKTKSASQIKLALKQKAVQSLTPGTPASGSKAVLSSTASLMTIPRPQLKIQSTPRQIGQKSRAAPIQMSVRGATPMDTQMAGKKIRLDSGNINVLTSIVTPPLTSFIRQNTPAGVPIVSSNISIAPAGIPIAPAGNTTIGMPIMNCNQGFQVIIPPQHNQSGSNSNVLPVSLLQSGIIQRVSNANTNGNVDVES